MTFRYDNHIKNSPVCGGGEYLMFNVKEDINVRILLWGNQRRLHVRGPTLDGH